MSGSPPTVGESPQRALEGRLCELYGGRVGLVPIGASGHTFLVITARACLIAKSFPTARSPAAVGELDAALRRARIPSPRLVGSVAFADEWWALWTYVDGARPRPEAADWPGFRAEALGLLPRLAAVPASAGPADLDSLWLSRAEWLAARDAAAARVLEELRRNEPGGAATFAHGDYGPQNLVRGPDGLVLIDWAEAGFARPGFDAGWLLALNGIGAGLRLPRAELGAALAAGGLPRSNLRWYEGLGLLRLHWRTTRWVVERPELGARPERTRAALERFASAGGEP